MKSNISLSSDFNRSAKPLLRRVLGLGDCIARFTVRERKRIACRAGSIQFRVSVPYSCAYLGEVNSLRPARSERVGLQIKLCKNKYTRQGRQEKVVECVCACGVSRRLCCAHCDRFASHCMNGFPSRLLIVCAT